MMLKSALWYRRHKNFSVIPIKTDGSKKPEVEWAEWQESAPSEEIITEWWKKWPNANVGIVTGKVSGITVMDFDWYKLSEEEQAKYKKDFPAVFTPTAISPRKGEHRYFQYCAELPTRNGILKALDIKNDGGYIIAPPSINGNGKYQWYERAKISDTTLHSVPEEVLTLIRSSLSFSIRTKNIISTISGGMKSPIGTMTSNDFNDYKKIPQGTRDEVIFHIANYLHKGGMPEQESEYLLGLIFNFACENPEDRIDIRAKIKSAMQRGEVRERNISADVREWVLTTSGYFLTTELLQMTSMTTRSEKKAATIALLRLEKEGVIAKHGDRRGCYRLVEKEFDVVEAEDIEFEKAIDISLPFFLEDYVEILPKDLIVIAGTPNSGKTALLLDMVAKNQDKRQCWYFSTEMSRQACKRRLINKDPSIKWRFKFVENFKSYEDVIKPDDINFIDYLEQNEGEAYKIPGLLAKIQRKLNSGIAVVALQKNTGQKWGIGGQQTTAKPALFLTVEPTKDFHGQILRIEKAKAFKDYNPNGYCMKFKIIKGINLKNETDWGPEIA